MDTHAPELLTMVPRTVFTRRGFVATSLVSGFALAAGPASADAIKTDTTGLEAGEVKVPTADGEMAAYRAMPASGGPFPTVLVIQEVFGVHEWVKDMCRRFAKAGYYAIAPSLYARQGDPSTYTEIPKLIAEIVVKVPTDEVMSDLDATVVYAKSTGKADTKRLAVTGFCWGGFATWMYAAHQPALKAAVAFYGSPRKIGDLTPQNPEDIAGDVHCPVLAFYAGQDKSIPPENIQKRADACKAANKTCETKVYPDAQHGFMADYRPSYNADAAKEAWGMTLAWFKKYGAV
ncbi:MAG TPA: dienelactone hydrolase family protein [Stellaceae bacterium]|jgi:carboxymethylenebutenolidase|nr:dienelactone hydrolase family protein [Stellaceae bacterium]